MMNKSDDEVKMFRKLSVMLMVILCLFLLNSSVYAEESDDILEAVHTSTGARVMVYDASATIAPVTKARLTDVVDEYAKYLRDVQLYKYMNIKKLGEGSVCITLPEKVVQPGRCFFMIYLDDNDNHVYMAMDEDDSDATVTVNIGNGVCALVGATAKMDITMMENLDRINADKNACNLCGRCGNPGGICFYVWILVVAVILIPPIFFYVEDKKVFGNKKQE